MHFPKLINGQRPVPRISEQLLRCTIWIAGAVVVGTIGYCWIEGWTVADGFYMTMITFSTVGYGETNDLSAFGRFYTSGLIFLSLILMACWTAGITTTYVSGELSGQYAELRTKKMIQKIKDHTIIFGAGIIGQALVDRLERAGEKWVLVEEDSELLADVRKRYPEGLTIQSNPKNELVLADANVFAARCVVSILPSDFDNLLVAMTVKELDPSIKVFSRSDDPRISSRMLKVGVDQVICPFQLSGFHIADLLIEEDVSTANVEVAELSV